MKWITRERPRVDRVACPWLIERFFDADAEFVYAPKDRVMDEAARLGATPYDVPNVELGHHGKECSFDAFVHRYGLDGDPAMAYMAKVIRGADTDDKDLTPIRAGSRRSWMGCGSCISPTTSGSGRHRARCSTRCTRTAERGKARPAGAEQRVRRGSDPGPGIKRRRCCP